MSWNYTERITSKEAVQGSRGMVQSHANPSAAYPLQRSWRHPPARSLCSALPYPQDARISDSFTFFRSGDCDIPWPQQQVCKGEKPNPPCTPASAFLRKQVTVWSWNMLVLNFAISLEGRNNIKPNSWALWRIYRALTVTSCGTRQVPWCQTPAPLLHSSGRCPPPSLSRRGEGEAISFQLNELSPVGKTPPFIVSEPRAAQRVHVWEGRAGTCLQQFKYPASSLHNGFNKCYISFNIVGISFTRWWCVCRACSAFHLAVTCTEGDIE